MIVSRFVSSLLLALSRLRAALGFALLVGALANSALASVRGFALLGLRLKALPAIYKKQMRFRPRKILALISVPHNSPTSRSALRWLCAYVSLNESRVCSSVAASVSIACVS